MYQRKKGIIFPVYKLFIRLDRLPKSLNKKLNAHYHKRNRENKVWDLIIHAECLRKMPLSPLSKANITIIRHSHRFLDYDGLVGSLKPVIDAFVTCGVLEDDSWNVVGRWNVDQKFRKKKEGDLLEILIQELPDKRN